MQGEVCKAEDIVSAGLIARPEIGEGLEAIGVYTAELIRDGVVIWTDTFPNVVTTQGKNAMLDKFMDRGTAFSNVAVGLHTTVGNAASTYASPSPQVEATVIAARIAPSFSASASGVKSTSSAVSFSITGGASITGAFLVYANAACTAVSDTAASGGSLFSSGAFTGGTRAVINGDTLNVSYSMTLT